MDVSPLASGVLVDEVFVTAGDLEVRRRGTARYLVALRERHTLAEIELWTTKKGRVRVVAWPECPSWVRVRTNEEATLDAIDATAVDVHIEHLDRGAYFVGFSRGDEHWGLALVSHGYIKTRLRPGAITPRGRTLRGLPPLASTARRRA